MMAVRGCVSLPAVGFGWTACDRVDAATCDFDCAVSEGTCAATGFLRIERLGAGGLEGGGAVSRANVNYALAATTSLEIYICAYLAYVSCVARLLLARCLLAFVCEPDAGPKL